MDSPRRPQGEPDIEVSGPQSTTAVHPPTVTDPIAAFPTSGQSIYDSVMKDMLLSLRASLQADIVSGINQYQKDVQAIGERIGHIKNTMGEYSALFNTLVDVHNEHEEDIFWMKYKIADL